MRKIPLFIPAIFALVIYLILAYEPGVIAINPYVLGCIGLMFIAAVVMANNKWYGCIAGLIVGIIVIYLGTQDTGQAINEIPGGIVLCIFYVISGIIAKKHTL